ncbi:MAG: hypothetical protein L3J09_07635 [Flavobacteriaceae bacterium]|nr:hypothetical protein [Flavobacteriaceae bacterium]
MISFKLKKVLLSYFNADIKAYNDYYPFGMLLPNRHQNTGDYRYGFQGQEMDDEIKGEGNSINYKYRMHDPRVGRFFAVDPLTSRYPHYTPYSFSGNKVIAYRELEGLEELEINKSTKFLVIFIQGFKGNPEEGATQTDFDMEGLGKTVCQIVDEDGVQVGVFKSHRYSLTFEDVKTSIDNLKEVNPDGRVILVGHSQGGDNIMEMAKKYEKDIDIDLVILLDSKDGSNMLINLENDNVPPNIKNIINYRQTGDFFLSGEAIDEGDIKDKNKTNWIDIIVNGAIHTSIDGNMSGIISEDIMNYINGKNVVKLATERNIPVMKPESGDKPFLGLSTGKTENASESESSNTNDKKD